MTLNERITTQLGEVCSIRFYEHPIHGDEIGMIAFYRGVYYQTDWYDLPDVNAVMEDGSPVVFLSIYPILTVCLPEGRVA